MGTPTGMTTRRSDIDCYDSEHSGSGGVGKRHGDGYGDATTTSNDKPIGLATGEPREHGGGGTTPQAAATTTFSTPATVNDAAVTPLTSPLGHATPVRPRRDAATARPSDAASAAITPAEVETTSAPAAANWQQQIAALLAAIQPPEQHQYPTASLATRASHASPGAGPPNDEGDGDEPGDGGGGRPSQPAAPRAKMSQRPKNVKELGLQPFIPTAGGVRVETWIAKVDLAVEGSRIAGLGDWAGEELYYVVGNKLQEDAAKSWVQINKELVGADRTWSKLKESLMLRYGERPDQAQAEWRVMSRPLLRGESYADFAAGLRDAAGQNEVQERTFLDSFYRGLSITTHQLVKLPPTPSTLNEAVKKAMVIDDAGQNVTNGMKSIGQAWATAMTPAAVHMNGTTGSLRVVPGIGSMMTADGNSTDDATYEPEDEAFFTNPLGVYRSSPRTDSGTASSGPRRRKQERSSDTSDSSESDDEKPPPKRPKRKAKAAVRQAKPLKGAEPSRRVEDVPEPHDKRPNEHVRCYACGDTGHFARECPDPVKKARNDAWLAERNARVRLAGNDERA
ncbi:hypothetical protein PR003_g1570 [Phytophthora rubi]|uniref:CCHC-type domain-containing protein n=1 Tax=Phytophthora rubi TaxID=129364 RepID=A0A6A4FV22_9STRA|nr:hypothetical protein PR003_g1570 [Phytophthora rubi]